MGLYFSTEHFKAKPDPVLLRKSQWHNSLQPGTAMGALWAQGEGGGGRTAGRSSCTLRTAAATGGNGIISKTTTQEEECCWIRDPDTHTEKERSQGRWLPILGSHCEDSWRRRDGSARFQMPAPAWALERPTGSMSLEFCFVSFWALQCQQIELKTDWPYRNLCFLCARVREWESEWVRGECVQAHPLVFWQESYGIWRARRALRWHPHQERWDFPSPGYIYTVAGAGKLNFKVTARKIQFVWIVSAH